MTNIPDLPADADAAPGEGEGDDAIPTLTEIVRIASDEQARAPHAPEAPANPDWTAFEQRVREDVLDRLERHAANMVDAQVRDALAAALERASAQVAAETRLALSQFLHELVARAVSEELSRVRAEIAQLDTAGAPQREAGD